MFEASYFFEFRCVIYMGLSGLASGAKHAVLTESHGSSTRCWSIIHPLEIRTLPAEPGLQGRQKLSKKNTSIGPWGLVHLGEGGLRARSTCFLKGFLTAPEARTGRKDPYLQRKDNRPTPPKCFNTDHRRAGTENDGGIDTGIGDGSARFRQFALGCLMTDLYARADPLSISATTPVVKNSQLTG